MIDISKNTIAIQHGGNLETAIKEYGFHRDQWIDLSTGISPWTCPIPKLADDVWRTLPPSHDQLMTTAASYYAVNKSKIIATPGSQMAIRLLPQLFEPSKIAIPSLGYQEHGASWRLANHTVLQYHSIAELIHLLETDQVEHIVIINPNNPSGEVIAPHTINDIANRVTGTMIIDEAFMDLYDKTPPKKDEAISCASATNNLSNNMIVLRSVGKFFGLAGIRLGFAIGVHPKIAQLNTLLQPWSISHASIVIAEQTLADDAWQQHQCKRIHNQTNALLTILQELISKELNNIDAKNIEIKSCGLFQTILINDVAGKETLENLQHKLAQEAIWTRLFNIDDRPAWLRFALPEDIQELKQRIENI